MPELGRYPPAEIDTVQTVNARAKSRPLHIKCIMDPIAGFCIVSYPFSSNTHV